MGFLNRESPFDSLMVLVSLVSQSLVPVSLSCPCKVLSRIYLIEISSDNHILRCYWLFPLSIIRTSLLFLLWRIKINAVFWMLDQNASDLLSSWTIWQFSTSRTLVKPETETNMAPTTDVFWQDAEGKWRFSQFFHEVCWLLWFVHGVCEMCCKHIILYPYNHNKEAVTLSRLSLTLAAKQSSVTKNLNMQWVWVAQFPVRFHFSTVSTFWDDVGRADGNKTFYSKDFILISCTRQPERCRILVRMESKGQRMHNTLSIRGSWAQFSIIQTLRVWVRTEGKSKRCWTCTKGEEWQGEMGMEILFFRERKMW